METNKWLMRAYQIKFTFGNLIKARMKIVPYHWDYVTIVKPITHLFWKPLAPNMPIKKTHNSRLFSIIFFKSIKIFINLLMIDEFYITHGIHT